MTSISITPGKNNVGAYINNINLNKLENSPLDQIKEILSRYGVIFIKKQNLDSETYQNFAKKFGELVAYPRLKGLENYPYINAIIRKQIPERKLIKVSLFTSILNIIIELISEKTYVE